MEDRLVKCQETLGTAGSWDWAVEDLIEEIRSVESRIPEEYRRSLMIELETEYEYGESYARLIATWKRPENEKERKRREKQERQVRDREIQMRNELLKKHPLE